MKLSITGTLVVVMTVLHQGKAVQCKQVEVSDLTTVELFAARSKAKPDEYLLLCELAAKTQLIDVDGNKYPMTYQMLCDTSQANFKKLEELDFELQLKLSAESLENLSS